ncbi:YrhK family protein [Luteimicrobium subarcticum]|uniref:YrhK-like protein n=1 Tax=Luteimicrobium subarcticum TaxID=620910 RepID=A0A2M8WUN3_9MICO|nr:YrhK family protein [Luteimicrobium subarcticum]PJI94647.1 YrhK-like protein [Luteimicrobium subarcticum]
MTRHLPLVLRGVVPPDATDVRWHGPRPFVTRCTFVTADGEHVEWGVRERRRGQGGGRGLTWWIGLLFVVGSACFVVGPTPGYARLVGVTATGVTFFVGSLFFTTAAYLSYWQVIRPEGHRLLGWEPRVMGFWATAVQLVGTLCFNVTTFAALLDLPVDAAARWVWRPDALGSVCFLVASYVAFAEAGHRWLSWRPGHRDWHITALNLWGSVFFAVSAVGAYVLPDGATLAVGWANGGTFLGAGCFLVAAALTMREARDVPTAT